ncbi:Peroxisome chaperone and import receptor [Coemansia sp. RSA 1199]|nr:Peroxisome chaperone and import receptor [Coemansia sp. RSA 1199]
MAHVPPNDAELDELLDSALEEFTAPSPKPKTEAKVEPKVEPKTEPAQTAQKPASDEPSGFEDEFVRQLTQGMEDMFKNSGSGSDAGEREMRTMLDQLLSQMGTQPNTDGPAPVTAQEAPKPQPDSANPPSFQDKIKATMDKLKESADHADAAGDTGELGMMEELMRQLDQTGDDPQLDSLVDDVIGQLMSKDVLEQPLKDLDAAYPKYLDTNKTSLSADEYKRFSQQHEYIKEILELFAASEGDEVKDPRVVELMQKMQDCGQPPNELLKLLAPDMELDEKGEVKVPEAPNCTIM